MAERVGAGEFTYEVVLDWARLPEDWNLHEVADLAVDAQDRVYVMSRSDHPVIVFDREGNVLDAWGEGVFGRPHGISVGPDGLLYCVDDGDHTIRQCTPEGRVLWTLGTPGTPAPYQSGQPFNRPTKVAFAPDTGDLYVTDGYGNARVHKFTPEGRLLRSWGEYGIAPGQLNLPHAICTDRAGRVYVADRENHRVQVFSPEGALLDEWHHIHRPCGLFITDTEPQVVLVGQLPPSLPVNQDSPNLGARISIHNLEGREIVWLGDRQAGDERPQQFVAPHGLAMDSHGDIYVGEVSWSFLGQFLKPPREMRCLRKLVRV